MQIDGNESEGNKYILWEQIRKLWEISLQNRSRKPNIWATFDPIHLQNHGWRKQSVCGFNNQYTREMQKMIHRYDGSINSCPYGNESMDRFI